jgi:tRNA 5-methylaminomethyl-2-thiouridine biosynthesis bifunctional protein
MSEIPFPKSEHFDDIYFAVEDGWAESHHVFLSGNNLPAAWENKDQFVIAETGVRHRTQFSSGVEAV